MRHCFQRKQDARETDLKFTLSLKIFQKILFFLNTDQKIFCIVFERIEKYFQLHWVWFDGRKTLTRIRKAILLENGLKILKKILCLKCFCSLFFVFVWEKTKKFEKKLKKESIFIAKDVNKPFFRVYCPKISLKRKCREEWRGNKWVCGAQLTHFTESINSYVEQWENSDSGKVLRSPFYFPVDKLLRLMQTSNDKQNKIRILPKIIYLI